MIVDKIWITAAKRRDAYGRYCRWEVHRRGWFLFGIIPLYIAEIKAINTGSWS